MTLLARHLKCQLRTDGKRLSSSRSATSGSTCGRESAQMPMWGRLLACASAAALGSFSTAALQAAPQVEARVDQQELAFVLDNTFSS